MAEFSESLGYLNLLTLSAGLLFASLRKNAITDMSRAKALSFRS